MLGPLPRSEALGGRREEAGSLKQDAVIKALDHAKIAEGPGGPAEMVPGQHHVRMNMYIAQASNGQFKIVKNLGVIDPKEGNVPSVRAGCAPLIRLRYDLTRDNATTLRNKGELT